MLVIVMALLCSASSFAKTTDVGTLDVVASEDQLVFSTSELSQKAASGSASLSRLVVQLNRVGNTKTVRLYLYWIATCNTSAVKFNSMKVYSSSSLNSTTYKNISGTTKYITANTIQHVLIANVSIPTSVSSARVQFTGLQVYFIPDGSAYWSTSRAGNLLVTIK